MELIHYNIRIETDILDKLQLLAEQEHLAPRTLARSLLSKTVEDRIKANRRRK